MIISELNTLETVEAVSVVGGKWNGGYAGKRNGGYSDKPNVYSTKKSISNFTNQTNKAVTGKGYAKGKYPYAGSEIYQSNDSFNVFLIG
jgi:hypothetical protein